MAVVAFAPPGKHAAHLDPIMAALPPLEGEDIALVASYGALVMAKRRGYKRIVLAQHGAGQSYGGDSRTARNPAYPGGEKNDAVGLFLVPNEYAAWRWQQRYPEATVRVIGCPRLDTLPRKEPGPVTVALSWHWHGYNCPEFASAFLEYLPVIPELARRWTVIGTGHPQRRDLRWRYEELGVEFVPDFDDVCRRADVLVGDNTSALYEWASTGRNVIVLNSRHYRPEVSHGGRFWAWQSIGPVVNDPADLADAVEVALSGPWPERALVLEEVYQPCRGGARLAAEAIMQWSLT